MNINRFVLSLRDGRGKIVRSSNNADATSLSIILESCGGVKPGFSATVITSVVFALALVIFPFLTVSIDYLYFLYS